MIRLENVSKVYCSGNGAIRAVDSISLEVERGQYVAVRGPSGSGKSTLLALIGGLAQPNEGRVVVAGEEISRMSSAERAKFRARNVGFVFQMFHLLPYLNVLENVLLAAPSPSSELRTVASELLDRSGLANRCYHRPGQLSAGERQRVAIARALLNRPQLLLADEPTGNLDDKNAEGILDLLGNFHRSGGTVLLVTHHENAARRAERSIALAEGRLIP